MIRSWFRRRCTGLAIVRANDAGRFARQREEWPPDSFGYARLNYAAHLNWLKATLWWAMAGRSDDLRCYVWRPMDPLE